MMKSIQTLLFGASLLFFFACGNNNVAYDASGTFEATEIMVSSEGTGKIISLDLVEGQQVKAGLQLGLIDTIQLSLKEDQLLASIKALQSRRPEVQKQIAVIQQQLTTARSELSRLKNLIQANAANQKLLDDLNAQIALLEKQLAAQKSTLDITNNSIGAEVATLEIQLAQINDQPLARMSLPVLSVGETLNVPDCPSINPALVPAAGEASA